MAIILPVRGFIPQFGDNCWLAPNATITGEVSMGNDCSVWFNAVVRGDVHYIKIGNKVNIQDGAIIHATYQQAPTEIGNFVSIGHRAIVHGCTVMQNTLIGMGAIVMDKAVVEENAIVAAGAVVSEKTIVKSGWIYAGIPAKPLKQVDEKNFKHLIERIGNNYAMYASWYKEEIK
ncbi:MAG: gamma carbonic anhydrase family protein [Chitinophagales bacterium]|nr:gamma carbonic anhydrase family protein [Chitinophagales bacterium]OJV25979.1 MAG: gamma carbonic anhydrase family protein [Bacteroidetes bacterium 37-13]HRN93154.1 gamma carbonic anhydrase family protein [Chitinophagales bacterium]HRP38337.1 gamma carbonic anhydrase family protein [Chitinophagales bacterium]